MKYYAIVGPHNRVNVLLVRGLIANFQIPIWYKFDCTLEKTEYLDIVKKIEKKGFHVASTTCDNARSNQTLAKALGVTPENPRHENPCRPGLFVYWFYDPSHLIKLVRNHLIDGGFNIGGDNFESRVFNFMFSELLLQ